MRRLFQWCCRAGIWLVLVGTVFAQDIPPRDAYSVIQRRNLFELKEPAPAVTAAPTSAPQLNILLTGITTILGSKMVLLRIPAQGQSGRPGEPAKDEGFILTEGQQEGPLEVLEIDERRGMVRILASGAPMTLTFDKNAPKLESSTGSNTNLPLPRPPAFRGMPVPGTSASVTADETNPTSPTGWSSGRRVYGRGGPRGTNEANTSTAATGGLAVVTNPPAGTVVTNAPPAITAQPTPPADNRRGLTVEEAAVLSEVQRQLEKERQQAGPPPTLPGVMPNQQLTAPGPYLPGQAPPGATLPGREVILPQ